MAIPRGLLAPFAPTKGWEIEQKGCLSPNNLAVKIPAWFHKRPGDLAAELQLISVGIARLNPPAVYETSALGHAGAVRGTAGELTDAPGGFIRI